MCGPNYQEYKEEEPKAVKAFKPLEKRDPPEARLARLLADNLELDRINPTLLRLVIQLHFSKITKLAHEIHDQLEGETK